MDENGTGEQKRVEGTSIAWERKVRMRILVVDDSLSTRLMLVNCLVHWGYEPLTARDGEEGYEMVCRERIHMVITDWTMPKMDGLELCRKIRRTPLPSYVYTIILTARDSTGELVTAMEAGADDYLSKPFDKDELKARIRAGERILNLEKELEDRNRKLLSAYSTIREDLEAAARFQKHFLPQSDHHGISNFLFDWIFMPCRFVAGDTFNHMRLSERHLGFFLIDVAGHGVAASMLSFTLNKVLSSGELFSTPPAGATGDEACVEPAPSKVMEHLNRRFAADDETMQYFTMVCGVIDLRESLARVSVAGHPALIHLSPDGQYKLVGSGSFPVGLNPHAQFEEWVFPVMPGDRLFLYSDGVTECTGLADEPFSEERLITRLRQWKDLPLRKVMENLEQSLREWSCSAEFEDDITVLAVERMP